MSTMSLCAICGGIKAPPDMKVKGRRCACVGAETVMVATAGPKSRINPPSGGVSGASNTTGSGVKLCCVCHADVTNKKRMKDSVTGRYWCEDCYQVEQRKKNGSGMTMRCPHCHKDFPPLKMVKHGEAYWCDTCHAEKMAKSKKKPAGTNGEASKESEGGSSAKLIVIAGIVAVGAAIYAYFNFFASGS